MSNEVMNRAVALYGTTQEASLKTKKMYDSVKVKMDSAIEGSKAVDKINELTQYYNGHLITDRSVGVKCKY